MTARVICMLYDRLFTQSGSVCEVGGATFLVSAESSCVRPKVYHRDVPLFLEADRIYVVPRFLAAYFVHCYTE